MPQPGNLPVLFSVLGDSRSDTSCNKPRSLTRSVGLPSYLWDALFPATFEDLSQTQDVAEEKLSDETSGAVPEEKPELSQPRPLIARGRKFKIWAREVIGALLIVVMLASNVQV